MSNSLIIDLFFLAVLAFLVIIAYKKGIFQILSGLLGTLGGGFAAFKLTPKLSGYVSQAGYRLFYGKVEKAASSAGLHDILESAVSSETFKRFSTLLEKLGITDSFTAESALEAGANVKKAAAAAIANKLAPIITFVLIFIIIKLAIWVIVELLKLDVPVLSSFNKLAGAALGALSACIFIIVVCIGIKTFGPDSGSLLSLETLQNSFVGKLVLSFLS